MDPISRIVLSVFFFIAIEGCSTSITTAPTEKGTNSQLDLQNSELPFDLKILEAVNNGTTLGILAELTPKTDWASNDVVVKLYGLEGGEVSRTASTRLADVTGDQGMLKANIPVQVSLQIPSDQISDYQVEALWGGEAREARNDSKITEAIRTPALRLSNVEVEKREEPCSSPPCRVRFTIYGDLRNDSGQTLNQVTFGVGFVWVPKSSRLVSPEPVSEQRLSVSDLGLEPGQTQSLELSIDKGVPQLSDGEYKPVVRIVDFG